MVRSTREGQYKNIGDIVWLLTQMGMVVNDIIEIKQQIKIMGEKRSCEHEAIARNNDACRTPPRPTNTGRAPRTRSPQTPPTPPTKTPSVTPLLKLSTLNPLSNSVKLSTLPSLSPPSPIYAISLTEVIEIMGPNFDIDLEIERNRYKKA